MRRRSGMFLVMTVLVFMMAGIMPSEAGCTAAGSCKPSGNGYDITCGPGGLLPIGGVPQVWVTQSGNGGEVEACNDEGANITQGRLVVSAGTGGVKVSLDSDKSQNNPPANVPPGYIVIQAGPNGVFFYCSEDNAGGDGYSEPPPRGANTSRGDGAGVTSGGVESYNEGNDRPSVLECFPAEEKFPG